MCHDTQRSWTHAHITNDQIHIHIYINIYKLSHTHSLNTDMHIYTQTDMHIYTQTGLEWDDCGSVVDERS